MNCIKCKKELPDGSLYCPWCGKKQSAEKRKALKRANGTGTVYKLSGRRRKPWVAAKNKVVLGYYESRTQALEALEMVSGANITSRYNMTFAQVYDEWSKEHFPKVSQSSIGIYKASYNAFSSLHKRMFRTLTTADFQAVLDANVNAGKSKSAIDKYKQLITQMSRWALREDVIDKDRAVFTTAAGKSAPEKQVFTEEEIQKLTECATGNETAKIIMMLICTGMRIGELFALPVDDYHETYCVGGEKTAAGKNRIIPILPQGRQYFSYFADLCVPGDKLLSGYLGDQTVDGFRNKCYYPLLERLGIERKTPHSTRHTFASRARLAGVPQDVLQKILGHADYSTTANIYLHVSPDELVAAVNGIQIC